MNVSVIVATCGDSSWVELARAVAVPSAAAEVDAAPDRRLIQIHRPRDTVAETRNKASRRARDGDWLCFLDADDELEPGYLVKMEQTARLDEEWGTGRTLLVPLLRRVHNGNLVAWATYPNKGRWPRLNECVVGTLVQQELFNAVGGFRDHTDDGTPITMYEDWDLWLRCYAAGARLTYTDAVYREHVSGGRNTNPEESQRMYDAIWRDHEARLV